MRGAVLEQRAHPVEIFGKQHRALREDQLEDRIVRYTGPVDQVIKDVLIRAERQDLPDDLDRLAHFLVEKTPLGNLRDVPEVDSAVGGHALGSNRHLCQMVRGNQRPLRGKSRAPTKKWPGGAARGQVSLTYWRDVLFSQRLKLTLRAIARNVRLRGKSLRLQKTWQRKLQEVYYPSGRPTGRTPRWACPD